MTAHAKLSASGAHRWMTCSGSVEMEEDFPDTSSTFAEHGTAAHELAERCLKEDVTADFYRSKDFNGFAVDAEMVEAIQLYLDYVRNHSGEKWVEQRVDFSPWVPGGFGTCDCLVIEGKTASVIDLKYGKGVKVDACNNSQAMLYALGALNEYEFLFDEIEIFKLAIVQPRLDHISEHTISKKELLAFGEYAKERAEAALAESAPFTPGDKQCRFCKAKASCRALAEHSLKIAAEGFEAVEIPLTLKDPKKLTSEEVAALLPQLNLIVGWAKAIEAYALATLEHGQEIPGYKVVEGRSIRKWADESAAENALRRSKLKIAEIFTKKLISPTQTEKLLGKNHPILREFSVKPEGKPAIAVETDKRPTLVIDVAEGFSKAA